jgi:hypothetical protein
VLMGSTANDDWCMCATTDPNYWGVISLVHRSLHYNAGRAAHAFCGTFDSSVHTKCLLQREAVIPSNCYLCLLFSQHCPLRDDSGVLLCKRGHIDSMTSSSSSLLWVSPTTLTITVLRHPLALPVGPRDTGFYL